MLGPVTTTDPSQVARSAAAQAAVRLIEPGMTVGLGSGRAVWAVIGAIAERWPDSPPVRAAVASDRTESLVRQAGIELVELDGESPLDLALDGADEIDPELGLIKGGGAALLREKLVVAAAQRFVVVAETRKRVQRLGERHGLPVEVVRFGWRDTRRRLMPLVDAALLRMTQPGQPVVTEEGHYLVDCIIRKEGDLHELAAALKATVGVVEHGLFLDEAETALLGTPDGGVERVERP
jgi:ribose 5-phosphate isomerase A